MSSGEGCGDLHQDSICQQPLSCRGVVRCDDQRLRREVHGKRMHVRCGRLRHNRASSLEERPIVTHEFVDALDVIEYHRIVLILVVTDPCDRISVQECVLEEGSCEFRLSGLRRTMNDQEVIAELLLIILLLPLQDMWRYAERCEVGPNALLTF